MKPLSNTVLMESRRAANWVGELPRGRPSSLLFSFARLAEQTVELSKDKGPLNLRRCRPD